MHPCVWFYMPACSPHVELQAWVLWCLGSCLPANTLASGELALCQGLSVQWHGLCTDF